MRAHVLTPLALLSSACVVGRPPSDGFLARAEPVPGPRDLFLPSAHRAFAAWQLPADDPWARFSKWTLLASLGDSTSSGQLPDVRSLSVVARAERLGAQLAATGLPPDTMWVVDLRGAASVAFGNAMSHAAPHPVSLVLTFNNWPAAQELIPAEETLAALVTLRPRLPEPSVSGSRPVFLLDAWRLAFRDEETDDQAVDNRYYLTSSDLPPPEVLRDRGIRQIVYVTETLGTDPESAVEEDDLHETFMRYAQAGVGITLLGMDELDGEGPQVVQRVITTRRYIPRPRSTVLLSPGFYARSRGGFGGPRARPLFHGVFHHSTHHHHHGHGRSYSGYGRSGHGG